MLSYSGHESPECLHDQVGLVKMNFMIAFGRDDVDAVTLQFSTGGRSMACSQVLIVVLALSVSAMGQAGASSPQPTSAKPQRPTSITVGQMTATEQIHSKLFRDEESSEDLADVARRGKDGYLVENPPMPVLETQPTPLSELVAKNVCGSDLVVIGEPLSCTSQLTANHHWVFSEVTLRTSQVLKPYNNVRQAQKIVIVRSGGAVLINTHKVEAVAAEGTISTGSSYLLFLKYISETGAYIESGPTFSIVGRQLKRVISSDRSYRSMTVSEMSSLVQNERCSSN